MNTQIATPVVNEHLSDSYFDSMDERLSRKIFRVFSEFVSSDEAKELGKQDVKLGGKIRLYKSRYRKDELSPMAALSLLMDCN